jgi:hypothetical protein
MSAGKALRLSGEVIGVMELIRGLNGSFGKDDQR